MLPALLALVWQTCESDNTGSCFCERVEDVADLKLCF